jgi:hypothetical protein
MFDELVPHELFQMRRAGAELGHTVGDVRD